MCRNALVTTPCQTWFWPEHRVRPGGNLLLFGFVVGPNRSPGSLGFRNLGWTARLISNPDEEPPRWKVRKLETPANPWRVLVGAAVLVQDGQMYLFGADEPRHDVFLLRVAAESREGRLGAIERWCGGRRGWLPQSKIESPPEPVFLEGQTEFSVHRDSASGRYLQVQTVGYGATDISMRTAVRLQGPRMPLRKLYRPPESDAPDAFVYAGKAHPELRGADLILTCANGKDSRVATDMSIYFPRFVRVPMGR